MCDDECGRSETPPDERREAAYWVAPTKLPRKSAAARASASAKPVVLVLLVISKPLSKAVRLNEQPPGGVAPDRDDTTNQRARIRRQRYDSELSA